MASTARYATGGVGAAIGAVMLIFGASLLLSGPLFQAESSSWWWFLGGSEASSATVMAVGVLGVLLVLLGGYLLAVGLKGAMGSA